MPRKIDFGTSLVDALHVSNTDSAVIDHETIVINISTEEITIQSNPEFQIHPYTSTILKSVSTGPIKDAILVRMRPVPDIEHAVKGQEGWRHFSEVMPRYPKSTPLFISKQVSLGEFEANPSDLASSARKPDPGGEKVKFEVKVNAWWCPPGTNCGIHTGQPFFEFHTQLFGIGHMRKYLQQDEDSMYEDVVLGEGQSHRSFARFDRGQWLYPWHAYVGRTNCIWLAVQYHNA